MCEPGDASELSMEAMMMSTPTNRSYHREKGRDALEFWAESIRGRASENPDHRTMFAAIPAPDTLISRAKLPPTTVKKAQMQVLLVESAFRSIGSRAAAELYGDRKAQSDLNAVAWEAYASHVRKNVRDLCLHLLVARKKAGEWEDRQAFAAMAQYGVSRRGFSRWVTDRLGDIEASVGRFV